MKLQTRFNIAILVVFLLQAVGIAAMNIQSVNTNTIRQAENRVKIYTRSAWEIYDGKALRIRSALDVLAQNQALRNMLANAANEVQQLEEMRRYLDTIRQEEAMDILNVMDADGNVVLRTRVPYIDSGSLVEDPMIKQVLATQKSSMGTIILELGRLELEGSGLVERCIAVGGEPRGMVVGAAVPVFDNGQMVGIIQMGSLLNGAAEKVDRIRNAVFANEMYKGKPVGTATIFMGDLRISTNVLDVQGRRAVGTQVSEEVAKHVLEQGQSWTGRAFVVDTWYLSQYDPIVDPEGKIIGMLYVGELEEKYLDLRTQTVANNLAVIVVGMLLALMIFFFLIRGILKPIHSLSLANKRLSEGDLSHRVMVSRSDEVGELAASFNFMSGELERQRREIERHQHQLEALNSQLQATNRSYMETLGFVTHELKNPLASAVMGLYTVKDGYYGEINASQAKTLNSVAKSLEYLHEMILNYLDLSRLEKGELVVKKSGFELNSQVVQPALDGLTQQMLEKEISVENKIPDSIALQADRNLMEIVFTNLLSNAIKYGQTPGKIVLEAQQDADKVTMSVWNDGEGIPPEKEARLFKKFSRLDSPQEVGKKGTGLGLYICKEIVEKHGGAIWVDSRMGEWVKFSFSVPK